MVGPGSYTTGFVSLDKDAERCGTWTAWDVSPSMWHASAGPKPNSPNLEPSTPTPFSGIEIRGCLLTCSLPKPLGPSVLLGGRLGTFQLSFRRPIEAPSS